MANPEQQIAVFLATFSDEIQSFAQALRTHLTAETNPAYELVGNSCRSLNIGYGFTTKAWDCYCAIIVYRKHINISLPSGALLPDPEGLLHGKGSRVRHLKIRELKDLRAKPAREILAQARENALDLLEGSNSKHDGVKTIIKKGKSSK